ncbi:MAG: PD40 domain-containing protein, partial [Anaerolineae bacterium]|nr:PD40 domain-containing protein [Anaerolineae bacterium]
TTATATPIEPTQTSTLPATATATPLPTVTETATPLPTATIPPFTQGRIVFLWDQREGPGLDGPGGLPATTGLYEAVPGASPDQWTIQPLLTELSALPQSYLSPDKTKLALLVSEGSTYKIHIYQFTDGSVSRIDNQKSLESRYSLSWLPDSQAVVYPQSSNLELASLDGSLPKLLTDNSPDPIEGEPYNYIRELVGSPDGSLFALDVNAATGLAENGWMPSSPRKLTLYDTLQNKFISITEVAVVHTFSMYWSPDSQWLAFTSGQDEGLSLLNTKTLEIRQLVAPPSLAFAAWSPDSRQLAFASDGQVSIWNVENQAIKEVTSKDYMSPPVWSPDGSMIATIYQEGSDYGIIIVNPTTQSEEKLNMGAPGGQVFWSPDGKWLLGEQNGYGLYVINIDTGEHHLVFDTAGLRRPTSIMWLP